MVEIDFAGRTFRQPIPLGRRGDPNKPRFDAKAVTGAVVALKPPHSS
jgi:hypothetical protein